MQPADEQTLAKFQGAPAPQSCRLIDFDVAEVRPGFVSNTWILIVRGEAPCANMRVELMPLVYVRRPEYWEIEVVGCLLGSFCLTQTKPYTEALPLDGILGTYGIEVVGANKREKIKVSMASDAELRRATVAE